MVVTMVMLLIRRDAYCLHNVTSEYLIKKCLIVYFDEFYVNKIIMICYILTLYMCLFLLCINSYRLFTMRKIKESMQWHDKYFLDLLLY